MLGGDLGLAGFGEDVERAVLVSFAAVVLLPISPAILRMQSLRTIRRDIGVKPSGES